MKKVRLIIAVVAIALMVMGVGYAAWGYTLPVDVKGDLYTFHPVIDYVTLDDGGAGKSINYIIKDNGLSATITTPKMYPGCEAMSYLIHIQNLSTDMSARLTNVNFSAMTGGRSSIVQVEYDNDEWLALEKVDHAGWDFAENIILAPGAGMRFRVIVSVPAEVTAFPFGADNAFSFTVTPTFAQVNP